MELLQLKYFVDAARTENFSHTAKRNIVPQSSISQTIKKLENELGVKLFERRGNKVIINENGKVFQKGVETALKALDDAKRTIKTNANENSGELKLLIRTNRRLVTECISHFKNLYPNVSFSLDHSQFCTDYSKFDMVIAEESSEFKNFDKELLISENILLAVPKDHHFAKNDSVNLNELKSERFISMPVGSSLYKIMMEVCYNSGFEPNIAIEIDDPYYLRKYIEIGLGVAFVPELSWQNLFNDKVKLLKISNFILKRDTNVYWNSHSYTPNIAKLFHKCLIEHFE